MLEKNTMADDNNLKTYANVTFLALYLHTVCIHEVM